MDKKLKVKCPSCKSEFLYYKSKFRPFCCERCKMIDLGEWFFESYKVPSKSPLEDQDIETIEKAIQDHEENYE